MSATPDPGDPRYDALLQLLRTADMIWNASHALFDRWDVSPSQFNVLNLLHLTPEGLSQSELGRLLVMHRSNVTGLVDRLEQRGLVARRDVAGDRRAYRVVLTPPGRKVVLEILPHYYAAATEVWGRTPPRRVREFAANLARLTANAESIARRLSGTASKNPPRTRG